MARSIRIEYEGAFYHLIARGNRRADIFESDEDRSLFLTTLGEACGKTGWRVHAWVLMSSHYHILLMTPEPNLVSGMTWLQNAYTRRFNTRHRQWGRLFGDRYKSVLVEGSGHYYRSLMDYIHLNPARAGLTRVSEGQSVMDYRWSSVAMGYALPPGKRAKWMAVEEGLEGFNLPDTVAGRREFVSLLDQRATEEASREAGVPAEGAGVDRRASSLRKGWYWGSQQFAETMLKVGEAALRKPRHRTYRASWESRAHGEREAERLLSEGMKAGGLEPDTLETTPGSEAKKVAIARVIWEKTNVDLKWIASRLWMKSPANASQQLRRQALGRETLPKPLRKWILQSRNVA
jgi:putative transposase